MNKLHIVASLALATSLTTIGCAATRAADEATEAHNLTDTETTAFAQLLPEGEYRGTFESRSSDSTGVSTGAAGYLIHWASNDKVEVAEWISSDSLEADGWSVWVFLDDTKFEIRDDFDGTKIGTGEMRDGGFRTHVEQAGAVFDETLHVSGSTMVTERVVVVTSDGTVRQSSSKAVLEKQPECTSADCR